MLLCRPNGVGVSLLVQATLMMCERERGRRESGRRLDRCVIMGGKRHLYSNKDVYFVNCVTNLNDSYMTPKLLFQIEEAARG